MEENNIQVYFFLIRLGQEEWSTNSFDIFTGKCDWAEIMGVIFYYCHAASAMRPLGFVFALANNTDLPILHNHIIIHYPCPKSFDHSILFLEENISLSNCSH